jgi:hypothetical protein
MKQLLYSLILLFPLGVFARHPPAAKADTATTELWYNEQYFITDQNCDFAAIRRVAQMDAEKKIFTGDFTDYDRKGHVIMTGSYTQEGKKNGVFRVWYPGGYLKMEAQYANGEPTGTWFFYYNDGKPLCILKAGPAIQLTDYWNLSDVRAVKEGNGKYAFTGPAFGYNEEGYTSVNYSGRIVNGLPDGEWQKIYIFPDGRFRLALSEQFEDGQYRYTRIPSVGIDTLGSRMQFVPVRWYNNAELMQAKPCRVDDQFNFSSYLRDMLNARVQLKHLNPIPPEVNFTLNVNRRGRSSNLKLEPLPGEANTRLMRTVLQRISYWIPSQEDGKAINDVLSVSIRILSAGEGEFRFDTPVILRKNGS